MKADFPGAINLLIQRLKSLNITGIQLTENPSMKTLLVGEEGVDILMRDASLRTLETEKFGEYLTEQLKEEETAGEVDLSSIYDTFNTLRKDINTMIDECEKWIMKTCFSATRTQNFLEEFSDGLYNDDEKLKSGLDLLLRSQALGSIDELRRAGLRCVSKLAGDIPREARRTIDECKKIITVKSLESEIVSSPDDFTDFMSWQLQKVGVPVKKYELLFRGSRDGFRAADFHKRCDKKGATVVLVKSATNHIFGGFAHTSWTSPSYGVYLADPKAFLFSWNFKEIYSQFQNYHKALIHDSDGGPTFGAGNDLHIASYCNTNEQSFSRMNNTYTTNGRSDKDITGGVDTNNNGVCKFRVSEYEVWEVVV